MSANINEFTVTRQLQWPNGDCVVEVSQGGSDFSNPDALVAKYSGEFDTFISLVEATECAIEIAKSWQADCKKGETILIAVGCTHGNTLPFEGEELTEETFSSLRKSAVEFDAALPKCAECGEILGKEKFGCAKFDEYDCCSEYCAEKRYAYVFDECQTDPMETE